MPLYKVQELFGQEWLVQRLSPPTVSIKVYGDQEVKVIGSIVLYMYMREKTDRVIWQVTDKMGVPILGRTQAKLKGKDILQSQWIVSSLQTMHIV